MPKGVVQIPVPVLSSVETLDELQDWLTAQNPEIMGELREARQEDLAGKFKPWQPRHTPWPTASLSRCIGTTLIRLTSTRNTATTKPKSRFEHSAF